MARKMGNETVIEAELLDRMKVLAKKRNVGLNALIEEALREYLDRHEQDFFQGAEDDEPLKKTVVIPYTAEDEFSGELIQQALKEFIGKHDTGPGVNTEKRKHTRRKSMIPAMVYENSLQENTGKSHSSTILDISPGGARISFPLETEPRIEFINNASDFEMICYLNDMEHATRLNCRFSRLQRDRRTIQVGAAFYDMDNTSYEQLRSYCTQ